jgi:hypothetical protein
MFDLLGPIGGIQGQDGSLEYGNVGITNCVYLSIKGNAEVVPTVIFTPEELESLIRIVEVACDEVGRVQKGSILRLGSMRPKPITLRLALVHPHDGSPFLLMRFLQGSWNQDFIASPLDTLKLLKTGQTEGAPPLLGPLQRHEGGVWEVAGKRLSLLEGLSPGIGFHGEYLHPDEVAQGEELEVWTFQADGKELVATFRLKNRWKAPEKISEPLGQQADLMLSRGETHRARERYRKLAETQIKSQRVVAPWAAKVALGVMLCELADGDDQKAQTIWLGRSDEKFLKIGLQSLEAGQSGPADFLLYHQVSAYFHSLNPNLDEAVAGVNKIMGTVYNEINKNDTPLRRLTLSNWFLHLKEVYEGPPSESALSAWNEAKKDFAGEVRPKAICFPHPDPWQLDESELLTAAPTAPSPEPTSPLGSNPEPMNWGRNLTAAVLVVLCLLLLKAGFNKSTAEGGGGGELQISLNGHTLSETREEMLQNGDWPTQEPGYISTKNGFTATFDSKGNIENLFGSELMVNGRTVLNGDFSKSDALAILGPPSKVLKGEILCYVLNDGGQRCILEINNFKGLRNIGLSLAHGKWSDYEEIDLAQRLQGK